MLGASVLLWVIHFLVMAGVQQAAVVNMIVTVAKIAPIVLFVGIVAVAFKVDIFKADFTGFGNVDLGSIMNQVKNTMLVTLWVFIGIEGASVFSPAPSGARTSPRPPCSASSPALRSMRWSRCSRSAS